MFFSEFPVCPP
jgi:hypothetical protein